MFVENGQNRGYGTPLYYARTKSPGTNIQFTAPTGGFCGVRADKPLTSDHGLHVDPTFDVPFDLPGETRRNSNDSRAPPSLSDSVRLDGQRLYDLNR